MGNISILPVTGQDMVSDALSDPSVYYVNFVYGPLDVNPTTLRSVIERLGKPDGLEAAIDVARLPQDAGAMYDQFCNAFVLRPTNDKSVIIHEAIHALQDGIRFPSLVTQAEATAYLGDAAFRLAHLARTQGASIRSVEAGLRSVQGPIFAAATKVAVSLGMPSQRRIVVTPTSLVEIENEIRKSPLYARHAGGSYNFNGVGAHRPGCKRRS
jgi:hypothetical protein